MDVSKKVVGKAFCVQKGLCGGGYRNILSYDYVSSLRSTITQPQTTWASFYRL